MCHKCYCRTQSFTLNLLKIIDMIFQAIKNLFSGGAKKDIKEIAENAFLLDVRSESEFANGHVKGSVNIPMNHLNQKIDFLKTKQPIVVFCQSGMRAGMAKALLNKNGISEVTNVGGWQKVSRELQRD